MTAWFTCRLCAIAYDKVDLESHYKRHAEYRAVYRESDGRGVNIVVRIPPKVTVIWRAA